MLPVKGSARQLKVLYQGHDFSLNVANGSMVNLTDLWRMAGEPENQDPSRWLRLPTTEAFIEACLQVLDPCGSQNRQKSPILKPARGKGGGTWAHWQVALAYAKYLSPQFHLVVNQVFKERLEEERNPELGVTRATQRAVRSYERKGKDPQWIQKRLGAIGKRTTLTSTFQHFQIEEKYGYATCTNEVYRGGWGATAKELKERLELPKSANLRDHMTPVGLDAISLAESIAEEKIRQEGRIGTQACAEACRMAGRAVRQALESAQVTGFKEKL